MDCDPIRELLEELDKHIKRLEKESAIERKRRAGVKKIIKGVAEAMEGIGISTELGLKIGRGTIQIVVKPQHTRIASGGIQAWEGWEDFEKAGGKTPTREDTLDLLKQLRQETNKEYRDCKKASQPSRRQRPRKLNFWSGTVTFEYTEAGKGAYRSVGGVAGELDMGYKETHTWTIIGPLKPSDAVAYEVSWELIVEGGGTYKYPLGGGAWHVETISKSGTVAPMKSYMEINKTKVSPPRWEITFNSYGIVVPSVIVEKSETYIDDSGIKTMIDESERRMEASEEVDVDCDLRDLIEHPRSRLQDPNPRPLLSFRPELWMHSSAGCVRKKKNWHLNISRLA